MRVSVSTWDNHDGRSRASYYDSSLRLTTFEGYDAEQNCKWAGEHKLTMHELLRAGWAFIFDKSVRESGSPWIERVGLGGDWDFKRGGNKHLADIGNYNYGLTARCAGVPKVVAELGAGMYQIKQDRNDGKFSWQVVWERRDTLFDAPEDFKRTTQGYRDVEVTRHASDRPERSPGYHGGRVPTPHRDSE